MKTTISEIIKTQGIVIFFILFTLSIFKVTGQGDYTITKDQISDEITIFTIEKSNGVKAFYTHHGDPEEVELGIGEGTITPLPGGDEYGKLTWLPDEYGGVLPNDIVCSKNKVFAYGGSRIAVMDYISLAPVKTFKVSDYSSKYQLHYSFYENRLIDDEDMELIYCATDAKELVEVDADKMVVNQTVTRAASGDQLAATIVHDRSHKRFVWIYTTWDNQTVARLYNYDPVLSFQSEWVISDFFYDATMNDSGSRLYVSTGNNGLFTFSLPALTVINNGTFQVDKLQYTGDAVYASSYQTGNLYWFDPGTGLNLGSIHISSYIIHASAFNPTSNTVFLSGNFIVGTSIKTGTALINTLNNSFQLTEIGEPYIEDYIVAEFAEGYWVVGGGRNIYKMYEQDNSLFCDFTNYGSTSVALDTVAFASSYDFFSANYKEGNITKFDRSCSVTGLRHTGMDTRYSLYVPELDKVYVLQSMSEFEKSVVSIVDAATGDVESFSEVGTYLIQCAYNSNQNKLYIAAEWEKKIYIMDCTTGYISENITFAQDPSTLLMVGNTLYCGAKSDVYVINTNDNSYITVTLHPAAIYCTGLFYDQDNDRILAISKGLPNGCWGAIDNKTHDLLHSEALPFYNAIPYDITYNSKDESIIVINKKDPALVMAYDGLDYSHLFDVEIPLMGKRLFYNELDNRVYALSFYVNPANGSNYGKITIIEQDQAIGTFESGYMDEIVHDPVNDMLYLPVLLPDNTNNRYYVKTLDCFTADGGNTIETPYLGSGHIIMDLINPHSAIGYDFVTNRMFLAERQLSCLGTYNLSAEFLNLREGWNWISFPRLERFRNESLNAQAQLERIDLFPDNLTMFHLSDNISYQNGNWYIDGLNEVITTKGYKLYMEYDDPALPAYLRLQGGRLAEDYEFDLAAGENWTGYFVGLPQWPQHSIPEAVWLKLNAVYTRNWSMIRTGEEPCLPWVGDCWVIDDNITPFQYGDLVILSMDVSHDDFTWLNSGQEAEGDGLPETDYFSFEEQSSYLPFFIDFDSTAEVQEIGVFADGQCRGAAVRLPGDTIVEVNAYLEGTAAGAAIEFQTWDGYKSSPVKGSEYVVFNPRRQMMEKRTIYAGENARCHVVSFKTGEVYNIPETLAETSCRPNPFTNSAVITFRISETMPVWVEILGQDGKLITTLAGGEHNGGYYEYAWNGADQAGRTMPAGIYFWRIRTGSGQQVVGKVVKIGERR